MKAISKQVRISPKKANIIAGIIRGKSVEEALLFLRFSQKKAGDIFYKVLHSAAANAENNFSQQKEDLIISQALVTQGPTYKRSRSGSRGRMVPLLKRTSHITVCLSASNESKSVQENEKGEKENISKDTEGSKEQKVKNSEGKKTNGTPSEKKAPSSVKTSKKVTQKKPVSSKSSS